MHIIALAHDVQYVIMDFLVIYDREQWCQVSKCIWHITFKRLIEDRRHFRQCLIRALRWRVPEHVFLTLATENRLSKYGWSMYYAMWYPDSYRAALVYLTARKSYDETHRTKAQHLLDRGGPYTRHDIFSLVHSASTVEAVLFVGW